MKNNMNRIKSSIVYAWDWPDIDGGNLTENDCRKFKSLTFIFSSMAVGSTIAIMQSNELPITQTILSAAIAYIASNYAAGKVVQYDVRKRKMESEQKIIYSLYRMNGLFNFLEKNLFDKASPEALAKLQCLEKELVEEDEADDTLISQKQHLSPSL